MADAEALKAEVKKLSAQAMQAKMDLHDLSEELPVGVEKVPQVAQRVCNLGRDRRTGPAGNSMKTQRTSSMLPLASIICS